MVSSASKMAFSVLSGLIVLASAASVPESEKEINRPGRIVHGEDAEFGMFAAVSNLGLDFQRALLFADKES